MSPEQKNERRRLQINSGMRRWTKRNPQYQKEWKNNNPERTESYWKTHYENNKDTQEYKLQRRRAQIRRLYKLELEDVFEMMEQQAESCAICGTEITFGGRLGAHIDHDHITGKVRGILCRNCNLALGHVGESIEKLEIMINYLRRSM